MIDWISTGLLAIQTVIVVWLLYQSRQIYKAKNDYYETLRHDSEIMRKVYKEYTQYMKYRLQDEKSKESLN